MVNDITQISIPVLPRSNAYLVEVIAKRKRKIVLVESKLPGKRTSKFCPHCFKERDKLIARHRDYTLVGPLDRAACDPSLKILPARISSRPLFRRSPVLRWLFSPPDPPTDYPWFESLPYATCKIHGRELVRELAGKRQFGRFRIWTFWIRARVIHTLNWAVSIR